MSAKAQDDLKPFRVWCPDGTTRNPACVKANDSRTAAEVFVECSDAIEAREDDEVEVHVLDEANVLRKYTVEVEVEIHFTAHEIDEDDDD